MGMAALKNRSDAPGSIARRAVIPRDEIARFMDRCWAADFDDGRRRSIIEPVSART